MGGTSTGAKLAEQFRFVADEKNREQWHAKFDETYTHIVDSCRSIANDGRYEFQWYDQRFGDETLLRQIKSVLKDQKFKVEGGVDSHYSEHAGKAMFYIHVSWR